MGARFRQCTHLLGYLPPLHLYPALCIFHKISTMPNTLQNTPRTFMRTLFLMYIALLIGQLFFLGFVLFFFRDNPISVDATTKEILFYLALFVTVGGLTGSRIIFKNKVEKLKKESALSRKLMGFQTATVIRFALIEAPAMLNIIAYLLTGDDNYLYIIAILIGYFMVLKPSKAQVERELQLSHEEKQAFDAHDESFS